jgi:hypothetical protein
MPRSREIVEGFTTVRPLRDVRGSQYGRLSARSAVVVIGCVSLLLWVCMLYIIVHFMP